MSTPKDIYTRDWITRNAVDIIARYEPGELTLRANLKEYVKTL